MSEAHDRKVST